MGLIYNMLHSVSLENRKPSKPGVCIGLNSASLTLKLLANLRGSNHFGLASFIAFYLLKLLIKIYVYGSNSGFIALYVYKTQRC